MGFLPATSRTRMLRRRGHDERRAVIDARGWDSAMCRKGARFSPASASTTICAWDAPREAATNETSSRRSSRTFRASRALLDRAGGALSGGEQQLLAIARCLCGKPRLVLLDEPTEGIQPSIIDEIVETLQRLREKSGLTMILVEQNLDFIAALSQRVLIIQKGHDHPGGEAERSRRSEAGRGVHRHRGLKRCQPRRKDHDRQATESRTIARRRRRSRHEHEPGGSGILS